MLASAGKFGKCWLILSGVGKILAWASIWVQCAGKCWHMLAKGRCWQDTNMLASAGTCWQVLARYYHSLVYDCNVLASAGTCWQVLANVGTCWQVLAGAGKVLAWAGIWLQCAGRCWQGITWGISLNITKSLYRWISLFHWISMNITEYH